MTNAPHVEVLKDIPKEKVDIVTASFRASGAASVTTVAQPDGHFTVTASWTGSETPFSSPLAKAR